MSTDDWKKPEHDDLMDASWFEPPPPEEDDRAISALAYVILGGMAIICGAVTYAFGSLIW